MATTDYRRSDLGVEDVTCEVLPLTAAQRGMWFAETISADYSVNIAQYVDIHHEPGGLDFELLEKCAYEVGDIVEFPYARLTEIDGVPMQYVDLDFDQHIETLDFRHLDDPVTAAMEWMKAEYRQPVDLITDQLIVINFLKISDTRTFWYSRAHHIIIDGYAALVIMRLTIDRYNAARQGLTPGEKLAPATMREIVEYDEAYQKSGRRAKDRDHWLERVADLPERVILSRAGSTGPLSFDNVVVSRALGDRLQSRLQTMASGLNSSLAVLMSAAFGAYLSRMSNVDDIVMSLPVTGRSTAKIKASGGMVSNVLPVRLRGVPSSSIRDLVANAQLELTGALRHQRYRSDDIRRDAGLDASSVSFGPTINMVFFDENLAIDGTKMEYRILTSGILEDLLINLYQSSPDAPLVVDLHGNPSLYTPAELELLHGRFLQFIEQGFTEERLDHLVADLPILTGADHELLASLPGSQPEVRPSSGDRDTLVSRFGRMAAAAAGRGAVTDAAGATLTYRELDEQSDAIADALHSKGIAIGDLVGVATARDVTLVVAILGILKAGAAYLPLDTTNPADRLRYIVGDARPACIVVTGDEVPDWAGDAPVVPVSRLISVPLTSDGLAPDHPAPDSLAYVIYTSGSTGKPKGVEINHRHVIALFDSAASDFDFTPDDVWSVFHSYAFDFSVWEIFGPLLSGGRAVIIDRSVARSPADFLAQLAEEKITVASLTPSAFSILADTRRRAPTELSLRYLVFGGEELRFDEAHRWYESFGDDVALVNMYGITETTVHVTFRPLTPDLVRDEIASLVGRPLSSLGLAVLDRRLRPVPNGAVGEIYVSGTQLARGYRNRPGLTAVRFVADPNGDGTRMYRTGDLGRRIGDDVQYLGRADTQVQLRGFRVELGEVETALRAVDGVSAAAAVISDAESEGGRKLIGYASIEPGAALDEATIRDLVRAHVPGYMVPDIVVLIDALPLTANGKLDRKALPAPRFTRDERVPYVAPVTSTEIEIVGIAEQVLQVTPIGMRDNIFALGADSLTAARLASRLRSVAGLTVSLTDVFEGTTLADLAAAATPIAAADHRPSLLNVPRPEQIPIYYSQRRLWFVNRLDPGSGAYNIPGAVRLGATVDVDSLRLAIGDVIARHEPLRTTFPDRDGDTFQLIHSPEQAEAAGLFDVVDTVAGELDARLADFAVRGFDLTREFPVRARLFRTWPDATPGSVRTDAGDGADGPIDCVLALVLHHIVGDGASLRPLVTDVMSAYGVRDHDAQPGWSDLPVQFADFAVWRQELLGDADDPTSMLGRQLAFWRTELAGLPDVLTLPSDRPRPVRASGAGGYVDTMLDSATVARLRQLAAEHGVTMFSVFHSALAVLLSRLSGTDDIAIGTAVAGRDEPALADLIGMFVNTVVLRTRVRGEKTVGELLHDAHHTRAEALSNADVAFDQVVNSVGARRSLSHSPLFQVELVMQHDQIGHLFGRDGAAADSGLELIDLRPPFAKFDLSLDVTEFGAPGTPDNQVALAFSYAKDLFDRSTVQRFARYFEIVLDAMTDPTTAVADLLEFPGSELDGVARWSSGPSEPVRHTVLTDALDEGYAIDPAATALVFGEREVTYAEFDSRVATLAGELARRGVGPESAVAVCMPRSVELLVAIHAIVRAGGHYVPVDVDTPADRVGYMLATAGASLILTGPGEWPAAIAELDDPIAVMTVDSGFVDAPADSAPVTPSIRPVRPDHAAYTIFTSGSTGRPKGVTVSHRAIVNRLEWMQRDHPIDSTDVVLQKTPVTFDVSVWELFWPFMVGARLVIAEPGGHGDPAYLAEVIARDSISTIHFVPSMLSTFLDVLADGHPASLGTVRTVFTSGEALPPATARKALDAVPGAALHNLYGPTEAAVDVTGQQVSPGDAAVPIGRPVANTTTYVLDARLRPLPVGIPGELYLGGIQLARGYASSGALTAQRFVADPFGPPGARLYRTGDLVRWNADGALEYLGRNDFQVKLRGQRLELGEIEACVASAPGVVHTAVTVATLSGGDHLVAYVAPDTVDIDVARQHVAARLPEFMRPTVWMPMARMPLGSSGKVDRKSLPEAFIEQTDYVAPRSDVEGVVAGVFADVLGLDRVGIVESFFDLGGNSLNATKVVARLSAALDVEMGVAALFEAPSVQALSEYVASIDGGRRRPPITRRDARIGPVSSVQRGMWLINRADPESPAYNVAMALRLKGSIDLTAIGDAFADVIDRHEVLRTRYPMHGGEPIQEVMSTGEALDVVGRRIVDARDDLESAVAAVTGIGFDVTTEPPLRFAVLTVDDDEHVLVLVIHHIAADGASMSPLARDVVAAYSARAARTPPQWSPLDVQYLDFALWQHDWLALTDDGVPEAQRQLDYWTGRLAGAPERIELPADRPRPRTPSFAGGEVNIEISPSLIHQLQVVANEANATLFMVLHAAFAVLLGRLTTQRDIVIGTPYAGRGDAALDDLVGMFVNTLALRTTMHDDQKFGELLAQVRDDDLADMARSDIAFDEISSAVLASPPTSYNPIYQVMFAFQNFYFPTVELPQLMIEPVSDQLTTAKVDLHLTVFPNDPALGADKPVRAQFIYATDLFDHRTVERFAERYLQVLDVVAADPQILVGDISITTDSERLAAATSDTVAVVSLSELVSHAAGLAPEETAIGSNGTAVSFEVLATMTTAMEAALGDTDSALTTAVMSVIPAVAAGGPDALGDAFVQLRANAQTVIDASGVSGGREEPTTT